MCNTPRKNSILDPPRGWAGICGHPNIDPLFNNIVCNSALKETVYGVVRGRTSRTREALRCVRHLAVLLKQRLLFNVNAQSILTADTFSIGYAEIHSYYFPYSGSTTVRTIYILTFRLGTMAHRLSSLSTQHQPCVH